MALPSFRALDRQSTLFLIGTQVERGDTLAVLRGSYIPPSAHVSGVEFPGVSLLRAQPIPGQLPVGRGQAGVTVLSGPPSWAPWLQVTEVLSTTQLGTLACHHYP